LPCNCDIGAVYTWWLDGNIYSGVVKLPTKFFNRHYHLIHTCPCVHISWIAKFVCCCSSMMTVHLDTFSIKIVLQSL
jgi:hypothetical protein